MAEYRLMSAEVDRIRNEAIQFNNNNNLGEAQNNAEVVPRRIRSWCSKERRKNRKKETKKNMLFYDC